ncbi:MAG: tetratricopeptide repeat protein, partial [Thermoguttaceae bacterium]
RGRYVQLEAYCRDKYDATPPMPPQRPSRRNEPRVIDPREELKADIWKCRFQQALIDFYLAHTHSPGSENYRDALRIADAAFDNVFQNNRQAVVGLLAHAWNGKTKAELGEWRTALDIYDEVLANEPEPGQTQKDDELQNLFTQVESYRLQILAKQSPQKFVTEAGNWVRQYRKTPVSLTAGYQAIALELAKAQLDAAENETRTEKSKLVSEALNLLTDISKVRSPSRQKAVLLRRQYLQSGDKNSAPESYVEALAFAEAAAADEQWTKAATLYASALKLADSDKIQESDRQETRNALANILYMQARAKLLAGDWGACIEAAGKVVNDYKTSPAAPRSASLAVCAALNLYIAAPADKKTAALDSLKEFARFTENTWPGSPEADEVRMMLAQARLVEGKMVEALSIFEKIDPRSDRYPNALYLAGETYWRRRMLEAAKPAAKRNQAQMDADRAKAISKLEASLRLQQRKNNPHQPPSRTLVETQLLLAEIMLSDGKPSQAVDLLQPLLETLSASPADNMDNLFVRIYVCAIRANLEQGDLEKAADTGKLLADSGPDVSQVNNVLINLVQMLHDKQIKAEQALKAALGSGNIDDLKKAQSKMKSISKVMRELLLIMATRKEYSAGAEVFLANMCLKADLSDTARALCLRVCAKAEKDPNFAKASGKELVWVRLRLVDLLLRNGDYEEANKQAAQLLKAYPRRLETLMLQGRVLQTWSEKDPARYEQAVAYWSKLRPQFQSLMKKPPEYYEITYNLAEALFAQARRADDKTLAAEKAKQAQQLLKSTLVLSPKLSGPEMTAKYKVLLQKIAALQRATNR